MAPRHRHRPIKRRLRVTRTRRAVQRGIRPDELGPVHVDRIREHGDQRGALRRHRRRSWRGPVTDADAAEAHEPQVLPRAPGRPLVRADQPRRAHQLRPRPRSAHAPG